MERTPSPEAFSIHASCVIVGEAGILIRGEPGAGKSTLALALIDRAFQDGTHAALVGDDRVGLEHRHGRLVARGHPALHGLIEIRGLGLLRAVSVAEAGIVRLVVDLVKTLPRLPDGPAEPAELLGVAIPRLMLDRSIHENGLGVRLVLDALGGHGSVAARTHLGAVSCVPGSDV